VARRIALWSGVVILVLVGLAAAMARTVYVADATVRMELAMREAFPSLARLVPDPDARMREMVEFDVRLGRHPIVTRLHTIGGAVFLLLAPLQFMAPVRRRFVRLHRWTGRTLLGIGLLITINGLFFALLMPIAGPLESIGVSLAGGLFLFSMGRAFLAIRSGDVERHREWMIRAFAVAIGISTVRVVGGGIDPALTPYGYSPSQLLGLSLWVGWLLTVAAAEIWIRRSRYSLETRLA
jgi:uncharacterized membrane protein